MKFETVVIETPKGQGLKYDYEPASGYLKLTKVMPAGLVFPFDFGYIPATKGQDEDPLDVIVISEIGTFPGCAVECRIIGAIKAMQRERNGEQMRNDRYIAVPAVSTLYKDISSLSDFQPDIIKQIEHFFISYNQQAGKRFKSLKLAQAKEARSMIESARLKDLSAATKLVQMLLPLYDSDNKPFKVSMYSEVKEELTERFGGVTIFSRSPAAGLWKNDKKKTVKDEILVYEVMSGDADTSFWEKYKRTLKTRFRQKDLVIRCSDIYLF